MTPRQTVVKSGDAAVYCANGGRVYFHSRSFSMENFDKELFVLLKKLLMSCVCGSSLHGQRLIDVAETSHTSQTQKKIPICTGGPGFLNSDAHPGKSLPAYDGGGWLHRDFLEKT